MRFVLLWAPYLLAAGRWSDSSVNSMRQHGRHWNDKQEMPLLNVSALRTLIHTLLLLSLIKYGPITNKQ